MAAMGWGSLDEMGGLGWVVIWMGWGGNHDAFPWLSDECHEKTQE